MKNNDVIGLLNFYTAPSLGEITENRPLGSTSFLGRYAFCDFALSNFCNSGISNMGLMIKDHQRSVLKHLGSMSAWVSNTKVGRMNIMVNEKGVLNPLSNTDVANIRENDWQLYDTKASYLVFQSTHIIANVDLRPILQEHIDRGEKITVVYTKIKDASKEFFSSNLFRIDEEGYLTSLKKNDRQEEEALASMEIWIINREVLVDIIRKNAVWNERADMKTMLADVLYSGTVKIHTYEWKGDYVRCFDSFDHYVEYCNELLNPEIYRALFNKKQEHFTLTQDTPPALYGEDAKVSNSFVANGAVVEGNVENCVLSRKVKIGEGSSVKNCIIFSSVKIGANCHIENAVIDKYSIITDGKTFSGDPMKYLFLKQGTIL
ncbi:MAG: glucose-1-phosphate adenylyltransferase subunit GlgD [Bacilli bacterium]|nr:glucose-1-phosphate adenylyltransferase subunit GlgD [Bacilli bacterium]